ncbi:chromatin structure-remodeling complex protein BSH [Quillaja saponaria]|uniref:Chromatin structure-remodeling complex protein BSH n=1 Tax=Quillaja saponaria TaxID=32244 RepID=A0AAD7QFP1_QUISA|nr:chromatin structure-remodeling complex protein BSH [Quillaja saponaria]
MMKTPASVSARNPFKFRIPTAYNLVPIRLDIEIDGQRYKDAFTWNPSDPDSEVVIVAKRTVKDLKLPSCICNADCSINSIAASRISISMKAKICFTGEKIVPIKFLWDLNNFESDPEEFARTFCRDMGVEDPEVGPAIAFAIREQLYEIAIQNVVSARESRLSKKGRRGADYTPVSKGGIMAVDMVKLFGQKSSVVRKRKEWDVFEPIVDLLSNEEVDVLEAREEKSIR